MPVQLLYSLHYYSLLPSFSTLSLHFFWIFKYHLSYLISIFSFHLSVFTYLWSLICFHLSLISSLLLIYSHSLNFPVTPNPYSSTPFLFLRFLFFSFLHLPFYFLPFPILSYLSPPLPSRPVYSDSLGGNSKTIMVATIRTDLEYYQQTSVTLMYASRAKKVRTSAYLEWDMHHVIPYLTIPYLTLPWPPPRTVSSFTVSSFAFYVSLYLICRLQFFSFYFLLFL